MSRTTVIPLFPVLGLLILLMTMQLQAKSMVLVPDDPGSIAGRVTDEEGVPLEGIGVALFRGQDYYPLITTETNIDGNYTLLGLGPGIYSLRFADLNGRFQTEYYDDVSTRAAAAELVIAGNALTDINAILVVGGQITGTVSTRQGVVTQQELSLYQQQAGSDAKLLETIELPPSQSTYRFPGLVPGVYYVCAQAFVSFPPNNFSINNKECYNNLSTLQPAQATPVTVTADQTTGSIDFVLDDRADRGVLTGTITTDAGIPLSDTAITLYENDGSEWVSAMGRTQTNADGNFAFYFLDPTAYALTFEYPDASWLYVGTPIEHIGNHTQPIDLTMPHHRQQFTATLVPAAQITGVVTFYGSRPPLYGEVRAYTQQDGIWQNVRSARTDATGAYTLTGLYAGTYRVGVNATIVDSGEQTFYGGDTLETATDVVLAQGEVRRKINWDLGEGLFESMITGTVTADDLPVADIRVELWHGYPEGSTLVVYTLTDASGRYRVEGLPASRYYVRFADPQNRYAVTYYGDVGVMAVSTGIHTDGTNQISNVDGHLVAGGSIRGIVRRHDGTPVANAIAGAHFPPGHSYSDWAQEEIVFLTNPAGEYIITGLLPGFYRIGFASEGERYPSEEFYGESGTFQSATDVAVEAGKVTDGIDIILGPDHLVWLPVLSR